MSTQRKKTQVEKMLLGLAFAVFCTGLSFGFSALFPQGERWLAEWQLSHRSSQPLSSSLALVRADEKSSALCGKGRWNLHVLESTFQALHQAGASVIAPMLDVALPIASECGGLSGLVQLAESTKQVGSVVYPGSVPSALAQAAKQTGFVELPLDEIEKIGGFTFNASSLSSPNVPFGIAAVSGSKTHVLAPTTNSFLYVPSLTFQQGRMVIPSYPYTDLWSLIQAGQGEELARLFKAKVIFLYSGSTLNPSALNISGDMVALLHAKLANAYLTNSWVVPAPWSMAFFMALTLGLLGMVFMLDELPPDRFSFTRRGIGLVVTVLFFWGFQLDWLWPLFSMGLAMGMTIVGVSLWKFSRSRSTVQECITEREQQLTLLEDELSGKQHHVRELETQLSVAQQQTNQSVTVIKELEVSQHTSRSQLHKYQDEAQETRQKIERLQEELSDIRQHVPVISEKSSSAVLPVDDQELIEECEAFKILTRDQVVFQLFHNLKKAAATQVPILLLGETGTGKEVFAKAAHALSPRRQGPFVSVNMAAIRAELFEGELFGHVKGAFTGAIGRTGFLESAHGGTLFLDEVGDLPLDLQAKLLRFLEDGGFHRVGQSVVTHVDVRIVAATNRDLQDEVRAGRYREDLYYRLRSIVLTLPPLRMRSEADHILLAQSFLQKCALAQHRTDLAFTQGALDAIVGYPWPGNIRELRQTIAQAVALSSGSVITEAELNLEVPRAEGRREHGIKEDLGQREDAMVLDCLRRHKFEMQATASTLGWDRGTVTQRLKGLGFQALMEYQGDIHAAARKLAGEEQFVRVVEGRLREYTNNLVPRSKKYGSVDEAIADCRKRFRNLPERHFPAVEHLLHERFTAP